MLASSFRDLNILVNVDIISIFSALLLFSNQGEFGLAITARSLEPLHRLKPELSTRSPRKLTQNSSKPCW